MYRNKTKTKRISWTNIYLFLIKKRREFYNKPTTFLTVLFLGQQRVYIYKLIHEFEFVPLFRFYFTLALDHILERPKPKISYRLLFRFNQISTIIQNTVFLILEKVCNLGKKSPCILKKNVKRVFFSFCTKL